MAKIYRTKSKLKLTIDDITVEISPLNFEQKTDIQETLMGGSMTSALKGTRMAVKYGLKSVKGIEDENGDQYELSFDDSGVSDECLDDLFNLEESDRLATVCISLLGGVPSDFTHPETGEPLEGVKFVKSEGSAVKK